MTGVNNLVAARLREHPSGFKTYVKHSLHMSSFGTRICRF